jgi:hypothetical protein
MPEQTLVIYDNILKAEITLFFEGEKKEKVTTIEIMYGEPQDLSGFFNFTGLMREVK